MGSELVGFVDVVNSCISGNDCKRYIEAKSNITNIIKYLNDDRKRTDFGKCEYSECMF
jgi:hypothetical protein